jgi:hypothetical protein
VDAAEDFCDFFFHWPSVSPSGKCVESKRSVLIAFLRWRIAGAQWVPSLGCGAFLVRRYRAKARVGALSTRMFRRNSNHNRSKLQGVSGHPA